MPDTSFDSVYNKALKFLSFRPRSEKEVFDYLTKSRFGKFGKRDPHTDEKIARQIINKLKEYKFISDLEFAKWYIENRRKGKRIIIIELTKKGIDRRVIEEALEEFDINKKENDLLNLFIEKKWKGVSKDDPKKRYEKLMRHVLSKGFDYDDAKREIGKKIKDISFDD